jgi:hypothetical protein
MSNIDHCMHLRDTCRLASGAAALCGGLATSTTALEPVDAARYRGRQAGCRGVCLTEALINPG